jgi:flagellar biosynthetic protein FliO
VTASPDLTLATVKMVLSLALTFALLWILYRWVVRKQSNSVRPGRQKLIRIVDSHYLGLKKSIAVVQVPGSLLVIGVGAEQINLLARIEQPEVLSAVGTMTEDSNAPSFKAHFKRLTGMQ